MKYPALALFAGLVVGSFAHADDWPQFRGPDRSGISPEKGLLKKWPAAGPKLAWVYKDAGLGHSSFAIARGVVYTLGTDKDFTDEYVIAIDEKGGKELWRYKIDKLYTFKGNSYGDGPRSTPTVESNTLYALSGLGTMVCLDLTTKKEVWRKNLDTDLNGDMMGKYGHSESPLIDGDLLICTPGGPGGTLAALDKKTGAVKWRSAKWTEKASFATPVAATIHGVRQYLQIGYTGGTAGASIAAVDSKGNLLWKMKVATGDNDGISTSPVAKGNEVYVTTGHGGGCQLFDIDNKQAPTAKYSKSVGKRVKNTHGGVVAIGDHIYCHTENASWVCQDWKTGSDDQPDGWLERVDLKCQSGAIVAADGMLYLYTDEGEVGLVEATPKAFTKVSAFPLPQRSNIPKVRTTSRQSRVWPHPAIANGRLYLRDHDLIFAFDIK